MKTPAEIAAEERAKKRYWDVGSIGKEMVEMDRKLGTEDFLAGVEWGRGDLYKAADENSIDAIYTHAEGKPSATSVKLLGRERIIRIEKLRELAGVK